MTSTQRTFDSLPWCNSPAPCELPVWRELTDARAKCTSLPVFPCKFRDDPILSEAQLAAGLYIVTGRKLYATIELWHKSKCVAAYEGNQVGLIKEAAAKWMRENYGIKLAKPTEPKVAQVCRGCQKWTLNHCDADWWPTGEWNYCHDYSLPPPPVAPVPDYAADKAEIIKALLAVAPLAFPGSQAYKIFQQAIAALEGKETR